MRGGALPPAILCAALGLVLAFVPLRHALVAAAITAAVAIAVFAVGLPAEWIESLFVGCWVSVIACAMLLFQPERWPSGLFLAAAANAGLWAGAVTAVAGGWTDLAVALPFVLLLVPGRQIVARGWAIALKVFASWLTAVAILATMVALTPTPGYVMDHME